MCRVLYMHDLIPFLGVRSLYSPVLQMRKPRHREVELSKVTQLGIRSRIQTEIVIQALFRLVPFPRARAAPTCRL